MRDKTFLLIGYLIMVIGTLSILLVPELLS